MNMKRVVLAGGSGFIGQALAKVLLVRGYEVVVLTRSPRKRTGFSEVEWDGTHLGEWIQFLNGAEAIVNLTGRNVNCPHTPENIQEILESRVNSVRAIALSFIHVKTPPRVWVQARTGCAMKVRPPATTHWPASANFGRTLLIQRTRRRRAGRRCGLGLCSAAMVARCRF